MQNVSKLRPQSPLRQTKRLAQRTRFKNSQGGLIRRINDSAPRLNVNLFSPSITHFRSRQIRQIPGRTRPEIRRVKVIGVILLLLNHRMRRALTGESMIDAK